MAPGIRWGRAIAGGLLIELVLMAVSVPMIAMGREDDLPTLVLPATALAAVLAGWWVGRRVERPALHGALAGVAAILLYVLLVIGAALAAPEQADFATALSPVYLLSHLLKVLGAALGGYWAGRGRGTDA
jgi:hypothetical protein